MKIAVALLTCDRYDYTVRTVEALKAHNDVTGWPLFYADDHSQDERVRPYVESQGFKPVLLNNRERMGCSPISDGLLQAVLRETGPDWLVLYLQNDFEARRPIPLQVVQAWFENPTHMSLRLQCFARTIARQRRRHNYPERKYLGASILEKPTAAWPVQLSRLGWYTAIADGVRREHTLHIRAIKQSPRPITGIILDNQPFRHIGKKKASQSIYTSPLPYRKTLAEVVVTMTTIPVRVTSCRRAIEAILAGTVQPNRIMLNVAFDPPGFLKKLPVDICRVDDIGPATKLLPTLEAYRDRPGVLLVTADDDRMYAPDWLESLVTASRDDTQCVVCAGGRMIQRSPYRSWRKRRKPTGPLPYLLPMGVYGVAYRPSHFTDQVFDITAMKELTPYNDDLWFAATRRKDVLAKITACSKAKALRAHGVRLSRLNLNGRNDLAIQKLDAAMGWPTGALT